MASGNQIWRPIWADFPKAPQNSNKVITVKRSSSKDKNENTLFSHKGVSAKITE
tara:strand:- start:6488 stop:6649 length:162 start_codon:yes stop_codon:yes gene_type:complete